ncbi:MAG: DUF2948 family protein [Pseudomonadota bacterium]
MVDLTCYSPLRLMAADAEDLTVLSSVLQDGISKVGDFAYLPNQRRFAFVVNRFVWECAVDRQSGPFARVRSGVHFDDVVSAQHINIRTDVKDAVIDILAISFEEGEEGSGVVTIELAAGGSVRLGVDSINAQLSDLTAPWPVRSKPDHALNDR